MPGALAAAEFVLEHAAAVAATVSQPLEVSAHAADPGGSELIVRVPGIDLGVTLEQALGVAAVVIPSLGCASGRSGARGRYFSL